MAEMEKVKIDVKEGKKLSEIAGEIRKRRVKRTVGTVFKSFKEIIDAIKKQDETVELTMKVCL